MKLSIIIPTLNEERYLPGLLTTIQGQDFKDFEIIVADTNSTDRTPAIAAEFGAMVVPGGHPAVARNNGARVAQGDILLFLDADVLLPHPQWLSRMMEEFMRRGLGIAASLPEPLSMQKRDLFMHGAYNLWTRLSQWWLPHAAGFCVMARRDVHQKINGFNESICFAEDHDYARRAKKVSSFGIMSEKVLVSVRRMERDGRMAIAVKYLACEVYLTFGGSVKQNFFKYTFGYDNETPPPSKL